MGWKNIKKSNIYEIVTIKLLTAGGWNMDVRGNRDN